jgi:hypothetical protein
MKFSIKEVVTAAIIVTLIFVYFLFFQSPANYGISYNNKRKELGLPIIEKSFVSLKDSIFWYNSSASLPRHSLKELIVEQGKLIIERDDFEFLVDEKKVKVMSYYHYPENCFNLYFDDGSGKTAKRISCNEFNSFLRINNVSFKLNNCLECLGTQK